MFARHLRRLLAVVALIALAAPAFAASGNKNAVQPDAKLTPDYVALPRMAVPVQVEGTDTFRQLEVELWVYLPNNPPLMQKLVARRSVIADEMRTKLKKNPVSTYLQSEEGPMAIKEAARDIIDQELGKDSNADILIKSMLVR